MPELSLYDPALNPQLLRCISLSLPLILSLSLTQHTISHTLSPNRCILYCEFDPNLGPRPVFQSPDNFVSNEILDCLSDHLIASSELCGHSIRSPPHRKQNPLQRSAGSRTASKQRFLALP